MARCWQVVTQREMFPGGTARATNPPRLRRPDGINHHGETNGIPMRRCCRIGIFCLKRRPRPVGQASALRRPHPVGHASALKGLKPSAQGASLGWGLVAPSGRASYTAFLLRDSVIQTSLTLPTAIESNATTVESNATEIESNATKIKSNATAVESNATTVKSNATIATSNACLCSAARLFYTRFF